MSRRRTVHKLLEHAAHGEAVNCIAIGPQSDQVVATGGDDCKVNLWRVGNPQNLLSLGGHQKPVECITFDPTEEHVVAGSESGSIKLFELAKAKVSRTLQGHRSNCTAVQVHPFNNIVASGSLDTNVKLWDVRKRHEFITFKGHSKVVRCLRFSPDGRWVASGGGDGCVKLWDLTAGKLMHTFDTHSGAVGALAFNPNEFLLASGSDDRTVKVWDLERFVLAATAPYDTQKIRHVAFTPDGFSLLTATVDSMRVVSLGGAPGGDVVAGRPSVVANLDAPWGYVHALHVCKNYKVLAASANQSFVSHWGLDLKKVAPSVVCDDGERPHTAASRPRTAGRSPPPAPSPAPAPSPPPHLPDRIPKVVSPHGGHAVRTSGISGRGGSQQPQPREYSPIAASASPHRPPMHPKPSPASAGAGVGVGAGAGAHVGGGPPASRRASPIKSLADRLGGGKGPLDSIALARKEFGTLRATVSRGQASKTDVDTLALEMAAELAAELPGARFGDSPALQPSPIARPTASPIDVTSASDPPSSHRSRSPRRTPRVLPSQRRSAGGGIRSSPSLSPSSPSKLTTPRSAGRRGNGGRSPRVARGSAPSHLPASVEGKQGSPDVPSPIRKQSSKTGDDGPDLGIPFGEATLKELAEHLRQERAQTPPHAAVVAAAAAAAVVVPHPSARSPHSARSARPTSRQRHDRPPTSGGNNGGGGGAPNTARSRRSDRPPSSAGRRSRPTSARSQGNSKRRPTSGSASARNHRNRRPLSGNKRAPVAAARHTPRSSSPSPSVSPPRQRPLSGRNRHASGSGSGSGADAQAVEDARAARASRIRAASSRRSAQHRRTVAASKRRAAAAPHGASTLIPAERATPVGLDVNDFLPPEAINQPILSHDAIHHAVARDHDSFTAIISRRSSALRVLVATWSAGNLRASLAHLDRCDDVSVAADFLSSVNLLHPSIKLATCASLLPHVNKLLASKFEDYAMVGVKALRVLFMSFSPVVGDLLEQQRRMRSNVVSISHEDRARRVTTCHSEFQAAHARTAKLTRRSGALGSAAAELRDMLKDYFTTHE